ncbi:hypothetical protein R1M90_26355, partial [Klebsiella sp. 79945]
CRSSLHVPCRGENTRSKCPFKFDHNILAKHSWDEPYQRLAAASEGRAWRLLTPVQGEPVWVADKTQSFNAWWR